MNAKTEMLRLVAMRKFRCAGDGASDGTPIKRHPHCGGDIDQGEHYVERDPKPDRYGSIHCLKCHDTFFSAFDGRVS